MKKQLLVIRFGSLGDIVLTSAATMNLKISFPDHRLVYLTKAKYRSVVECFDTVDEIVTLSDDATLRGYYRLLLKLDESGFDAVVDLQGNQRSWLARKLITANQSVVYPKRRLERYLAVRKKEGIEEKQPHTIDLYNEAVRRLSGRVICRRPVLGRLADMPSVGIPVPPNGEDPLVVVAPGAAHANKQWPVERFADVARRLHETYKVSIVWAVTDVDRGKSGLEGKIDEHKFAEIVNCPVPQLATVLSRAALTVANDSGVAHLSSAVGTPVVAVFGPTHRVLGFAPRGLRDQVVEVDEPCRPCSLHGMTPCYRERRFCLERVTPEMVCKAASRVLDHRRGGYRALFVDRDGTIIVDKDFLSDPAEIEFERGSVEALRLAQAMGLKIVIVSNQSGVARGLFDIGTVERVNARLLEMLATRGVDVDGLYYCPHHSAGSSPEYGVFCECRKPAPGMVEEAARQLGIRLRSSYVIGDKLDDFNLGRVIGARSYLVRTGKGAREERRLRDAGIDGRDQVVDNLLMAVRHIEAVESNDQRSGVL